MDATLQRMQRRSLCEKACAGVPDELLSEGMLSEMLLRSSVRQERPLRTLEEVESLYIRRAMRVCEGNISSVAKTLGIGKTTLYRKLRLMGQ